MNLYSTVCSILLLCGWNYRNYYLNKRIIYLLNIFILFCSGKRRCLKKIKAAVESLIHVGLIPELRRGFVIRVITKVLLIDDSRTWRLEGGRDVHITSVTNLTKFSHFISLSHPPLWHFKTTVCFEMTKYKTDETAVKFTGKLFWNSQTEPNLL